MKLDQPFLKLPVKFDAGRLADEVASLPNSAWMPHPQGFAGNEAVPLISPDGQATDRLDGPMAPTEHLRACPAILEALASLGATLGRSRLMALAPGADVPAHVDLPYHWRTHYRVHVPVVTNPGVEFTCDGVTVHMQPGECWIPDTFRRHSVVNRGSERRIHLVLDTVGGEGFWGLLQAARSRQEAPPVRPAKALAFERMSAAPIMPPHELRDHLSFLRDHLVEHPAVPKLVERLDQFVAGWTAVWAQFGPDEAGLHAYGDLLARVHRDAGKLAGDEVFLDNGKTFMFFLEPFLFTNAISRQLTARLAASAQRPVRAAAN